MYAAAKCFLVGTLATLSVVSGAEAQMHARQPALDWQTFLVPEFGTRVDYPASIFSVPDGKAEKGFGQGSRPAGISCNNC